LCTCDDVIDRLVTFLFQKLNYSPFFSRNFAISTSDMLLTVLAIIFLSIGGVMIYKYRELGK
jgi:hypothetical protein